MKNQTKINRMQYGYSPEFPLAEIAFTKFPDMTFSVITKIQFRAQMLCSGNFTNRNDIKSASHETGCEIY